MGQIEGIKETNLTSLLSEEVFKWRAMVGEEKTELRWGRFFWGSSDAAAELSILYLWYEFHQHNSKKKKLQNSPNSSNQSQKIREKKPRKWQNSIQRTKPRNGRSGVCLFKGGVGFLKKRSSLKMEKLCCLCVCRWERKLKFKKSFVIFGDFLGHKRFDFGLFFEKY